MVTAAEHVRRRTREEVQTKVMAKDAARGLLLILQAKFGALPPKLVPRIKRARMQTIDDWCHRALTAKSLVDVFVD